LLLKGRNAIVTGGSRGLGKAIAQAFLTNGANVAICGREPANLKTAVKELQPHSISKESLYAVGADVSRENDVKYLVESVLDKFGRLDIVVNNAAILGPIGESETVDWQEWQRTLEINLGGTMLLCRAAIPLFKKQKRGKIINLSGGGATSARPRFSAYAVSKAALVRLTENLAEELKDYNVDVNAIAPGAFQSDMLEEILKAGPDRVGAKAYEQAKKGDTTGSMERAAALCVFLASEATDSITGKLISAIWDPWQSLPKHKEHLRDSDLYTLRRIVPSDRGLNWEES
jgi:3-oxoacyl-[acyl-carrier protein] reductase